MSNKIVKSKKDSGGQDGNVTPTTIKKPVTRVNSELIEYMIRGDSHWLCLFLLGACDSCR